MKPAMPQKDVVPWAPEETLPWIFSMIAISAGTRLTGKAVSTSYKMSNPRLLNKEGSFLCELHIDMAMI